MVGPASPRDPALGALRAAMMLLGLVIHSAAAYTANPDRTAWPFQDPQNHVLSVWGLRWKRNTAAGLAASIAYVAALARFAEAPALWTPIAIALCSLSMWWLIMGITGAFVRHLRAPSPAIRYISDAAYWIYIVHLVVVIWTQGALATAALPPQAKFIIVLATTTALTVATYHFLSRRTSVGGKLA